MTVYQYKRSDNSNWYGVERSHRGKRLHKQGFRSRKAAEAWERTQMDSIDLGLSGKSVEITFNDYAEWWIKRKNKPGRTGA